MNVLWIIDSLGPGGAESLMVPLLKSLKEQGVESRVCVLHIRDGNPTADELQKLGIAVDLVLVKNLRNPFDLFRLVKYIRQYRPNIIHTQLETSDVLGTIAAWLLKIPSVSTIHTLEQPSKRMKKSWRNYLRWNCLSLFSRRVVVVSEVARQHYIQLGYRSEKLLTLYNGIDLKKFNCAGQTDIDKWSILELPNDSVVLVSVAVLREPKGIQYMLQAMPDLLAKVPNMYYVVVGDGQYRATLESLAESLGIKSQVLFMSFRSDIPEILAASDLFVHPTLADALPTVLFEAMAVGVPIIASQVGGVPEILEHDVNGLLVPPANSSSLVDACLRILSDKGLAGRLASIARDTVVRRFDVNQQARNLTQLYQQMAVTYEN
jgi:glycosyltransferase involved in cell wall biosynthesis